MITKEQHLEADLWLAEQVGECVHDWQNTVYNEGWVWVCMKCDKTKTIHAKYSYANMMKVYPVDFPRSKDLGAMVNVAHKIREKHYGKHIGHCFSIQCYDGQDVVYVRDLKEQYKDHPSPQHAAAWALYLALREVKK